MSKAASQLGHIPPRQTLRIYVCLALLLSIATLTPLPTFLERQVSLPVSFWLRTATGTDPVVDPRLKIISYDDNTVARIQALDLPLGDWGKLIAAIASVKPAAIVIDKLFDKPYSTAQLQRFATALAGLDVPLYTIGFVSEKIALRPPLVAEKWAENLGVTPLERNQEVYGAHAEITASIRKVGHALYDGDGYIKVAVGVDEARAVRHIGLVPWQTTFADEFKVAGQPVPIRDDDLATIVNLPHPQAFPQISMLGVLSRALRDKPLEVIQPGDYVLILPAMYTGNTDWRQTPHGPVPGGLINAAVMNSVLTNSWIRTLGSPLLLLLIASGFGVWIGMLATSLRIACGLVAGALMIVSISLGLFLWGQWNVPWILPTGGFLISGLTIFAERLRNYQLEKVRMEMELTTARTVQESLFTKDKPQDSRLAVISYMRPSSECSGDWWGHFEPLPGCHYVVIADATGHGVSAALVSTMAFSTMTLMMNTVRHTGKPIQPADLLLQINDTLKTSPSRRTTMTMCIVMLDTENATATISSGGHVFPFLIPPRSANTAVKTLKVPGMIVGHGDMEAFEERVFPLAPGDSVVLYTDGIIECKNKVGKDLGKKAARQLLVDGVQASRPPAIENISRRVRDFFGEETLDDDLTIVVATLIG